MDHHCHRRAENHHASQKKNALRMESQSLAENAYFIFIYLTGAVTAFNKLIQVNLFV
jgi:hypothetical protein